MNTIDNILSRRSIRRFTNQNITDQQLHTILSCALAGPSAVNARPFCLIVIKDKDMLNKIADGNGKAAQPLRNANVGVIVCGDMDKAISLAPDYWVVDCSIATQNLILAANDLGIGSVWLGTWPQKEKIDAQRKLFDLPESIIPHSIVALGYPDESPAAKVNYEADKVHFEKF